MRFVITEDLYNELLDRYCIEKSTSHRTEKVRKLVQCQAKDGSIYQAHRWVKIEKENKTYLYNINKNGIANIDNPFSVSNSNRTIE